MANFQWDKQYDIGVDAMNRQHKELLIIMERLQKQNEAHAGRDALLKTLLELRALTVRHFSQEEEYMKSFGYKDFKTHSMIHTNLIAKLDEHVAAFQGSAKTELPSPLFSFLSFWLSSHIMGIDKKYGEASRSVPRAG
jgi:hemerythrin